MNKKHLVLPTVLVVCGAAAALTLWSGGDEPEPPRSLCFGTLDERTAGLVGDGKGGRVDIEEFERKGKGDHAFFRSCLAQRTDADSGTWGVYSLITEDTKAPPGPPKGAETVVGGPLPVWASPTEAVAQLPAACPRRLGSTAPYVTVTLKVSTQVARELEKAGAADRQAAQRDAAAVVRASAENLASSHGCD